MRALRAALVLFFALPGTAWAARPALFARSLSADGGVAQVHRFDLVGLHWRGSGQVYFRTRGIDDRWSGWQSGDDGARRRGWHLGNPVWTGGANAIQYSVSGRVSAMRAFFVRSGGHDRRVRPATVTGEPAIVTRSGWGADERIRRSQPSYAPAVRFAIVHHTATTNSYSASQSAAIVRAIEIYHVRANGWHDIGYNFLVDRYGQIFEGRYGGVDRAVVGAHAQGFNYGSVGVSLIGDFDSTPLPAAARRALVRLLAWRLDLDHVDPLSTVTAVSSGNPRYARGRAVALRAISGHRDVYPTDCPGNRLYGELRGIARDVAATGLPKIYSPVVTGALGVTVRFRARISAPLPWTVTVTDAQSRVVASGSGTRPIVDWTWDATGARGRYAYTIDAGPDARPVTGSLGGPVAQLTIDDAAAQPAVVSPNGDGHGDTARITYRLGTSATVTATLTDAAGTVLGVLFTGARSAGPHSFVWKDVGVADGRYRIVLSAQNAGGAQVSRAVQIAVDRTLARFQATPRAISPNGDGKADFTSLAFDLLGPADVRVQILRAGRAVATLASGPRAAGRQRLTWNGHAPDGVYVAVVTAVDAAATVAQRISIRVDTKRPVLRLLTTNPLRFWVSEPGTLQLEIDGEQVSQAVRRPGVVRVDHAPPATELRAVAFDLAQNRSAVIHRP